jgi:hypothetical protein
MMAPILIGVPVGLAGADGEVLAAGADVVDGAAGEELTGGAEVGAWATVVDFAVARTVVEEVDEEHPKNEITISKTNRNKAAFFMVFLLKL